MATNIEDMTLKQAAHLIKANFEEICLMNWVVYCYRMDIIKSHKGRGIFTYKWGFLGEMAHANEVGTLETLVEEVSPYRRTKVIEHALWWAVAHKGCIR